jgi:hypothetical protein
MSAGCKEQEVEEGTGWATAGKVPGARLLIGGAVSLHNFSTSTPVLPTVVAKAEKKLTASSEQQADIQSWSSKSGT